MDSPKNIQETTSPVWPLYLAVLAGITARAWLLFSSPLVPGINGAYYLVQTRSLLEKGTLGIPDLPLTFLLQAFLAKILLLLTNLPQETAILYAVKIEDSLLPALVAIPVFRLIRLWTPESRSLLLPSILAIAAVAGGSALGMVGEFQKNSLGLVWLVSLIWSLQRWLEEPRPSTTAKVVLFMALGSVTHIGVFGAMCLVLILTLAVNFWQKHTTHRQTLQLGGLITIACSLTLTAVLLKFDPARIHRLADAFSHPLSFLQSHGGPRLQSNGAAPMMPPPGFGPGGNSMLSYLPSFVLGSFALTAAILLWRKRATISGPTRLTVFVSALTLLALSGLWVKGDKMMRFQLIAMPLAIVVVGFSAAHLQKNVSKGLLLTPLLLGLGYPSISLLKAGGTPILSQEDVQELQSVATKIPNPDTSLVVARHGLEWWSAWLLHTRIAQPTAVRAEDWEKFTSVFFLQQTGRFHPPRMGGFLMFRPNMPPPGMGPPNFGPGPRSDSHGRPPMGPMSDPVIPENAPLIHEGASFRVGHILSAPQNAATRPGPEGRFAN